MIILYKDNNQKGGIPIDKKLIDYMGNPVTLRLLIEIHEQEKTTAKKLTESYPDIPQATLYRYLSRMLKDDIIKVVAENKIRGTTEKVYALNMPLRLDREKLNKDKSRKEYMQIATQFTMNILHEFQAYTEQENIDIANDGSALFSIPLYMTKPEMDGLLEELNAVLAKYFENRTTNERQLRKVSIIISPPKKFEEDLNNDDENP